MKTIKTVLAAASLAGAAFAGSQAAAFELGVVAFQMSAETQARCANTVGAEAEKLGWEAQVLNSNGALETHASQLDNLIQKGVDAMILCMSKPVQFDAQFLAAKEAGIPVITISSGASPHTMFDVTPNEYIMAAEAAIYTLARSTSRATSWPSGLNRTPVRASAARSSMPCLSKTRRWKSSASIRWPARKAGRMTSATG